MNWSHRLLGRDRATSLRFVMLAVGLFVVVFLLMRLGGIIYWIFAGNRFLLFLAIFLTFAALNAYMNDGFLVSCLLAYLPTVGFFVYNVAFIHSYDHPVLVAFAFAGVIAIFLGIPSGVAGYFVGIGLNHFTADSSA